MNNGILQELERFASDTGLTERYVGFLLARNYRLVERLRSNRRIWPETEKNIRLTMEREREKRGLPSG